MKSRILAAVLMVLLITVPAWAQNKIEALKVKEGKIEITGSEPFRFETVRPANQNYVYIDVYHVTDNLRSKYTIPEGQPFSSVRVGHHKDKVRIVLQGPQDNKIPEVSVTQSENKITLAWNNLGEGCNILTAQPKGLTNVAEANFIEKLVAKVKGEPLLKNQAPPRADIDSGEIDLVSHPLMEEVGTKEQTFIDTASEQLTILYNDTMDVLGETVDSLMEEGGIVDLATAKIKSLFDEDSKVEDQKVKIVRTEGSEEKTIEAKHTEISVAKVSKASIADLPSKNTRPLKVVTPVRQERSVDVKTYEKELAAVHKEIKQRYKQSLDEAEKIAARKTALLQTIVEGKVQEKAEQATRKEMDRWVEKNKGLLSQLEHQHDMMQTLIDDLAKKKDELDRQMHELNSRNASITCREEPRNGYKVVFLPSGSLKVGLEALAQSAKLDLDWEAPLSDYYIDRPILLNGLTFDENLMIIHESLAQNQVFFMLEPNYSASKLRVRVSQSVARN